MSLCLPRCRTLPVPVSVGMSVACRLMNGNFQTGEVLLLAIVSHNSRPEHHTVIAGPTSERGLSNFPSK